MLRSSADYRESLRGYSPTVFINGRRVESVADDPEIHSKTKPRSSPSFSIAARLLVVGGRNPQPGRCCVAGCQATEVPAKLTAVK